MKQRRNECIHNRFNSISRTVSANVLEPQLAEPLLHPAVTLEPRDSRSSTQAQMIERAVYCQSRTCVQMNLVAFQWFPKNYLRRISSTVDGSIGRDRRNSVKAKRLWNAKSVSKRREPNDSSCSGNKRTTSPWPAHVRWEYLFYIRDTNRREPMCNACCVDVTESQKFMQHSGFLVIDVHLLQN